MSQLGTACFDIFSPPPGAREVMTQVERLSARETKIALRSVRIAACLSGRGQRACMVAPAWVVQHPTLPESRVLPNRAHGIFVMAYNFGKHLKRLQWRTPFQAICEAWAK